jgi:hypothetical protein
MCGYIIITNTPPTLIVPICVGGVGSLTNLAASSKALLFAVLSCSNKYFFPFCPN